MLFLTKNKIRSNRLKLLHYLKNADDGLYENFPYEFFEEIQYCLKVKDDFTWSPLRNALGFDSAFCMYTMYNRIRDARKRDNRRGVILEVMKIFEDYPIW